MLPLEFRKSRICKLGAERERKAAPDILSGEQNLAGEFMAAGPVSRILSAVLLPQDGHSSGPRIAAGLKRPTRTL